ncbi:MAG: hypothetical protein AAGG38_14105 [Planctomycetota bacterium]
MRITIDIHDEVLARAKETAAAQRRKLSDLVNDALLEVLDRVGQPSAQAEPFRIQPLPLGSVRPGIDLGDNSSLQDALDEDTRDPHTGEHDLSKLR